MLQLTSSFKATLYNDSVSYIALSNPLV